MKTLTKKISTAVLSGILAFGLMQAGTQSAKAQIPAAPGQTYYPFYNNYYNYYIAWLNLFNSSGAAVYQYYAYAYLNYYYAGFWGDYFGFYGDPFKQKSIYFKGRLTSPNPNVLTSTYESTYYNYYAYFGDLYANLTP